MSIRRIPITTLNVVLKPENGALDMYLVPALKKISIVASSGESTKVNLPQAIRMMYSEMPKHFNGWVGKLSAAVMMMHFISLGGEFPFDEESHMAWDQGFYFGIMVERLRKLHDIKFETTTCPVTADEMQQLTNGTDDEKDDDDE